MKKSKSTDEEQVHAYMNALEHPLYAVIEQVRSIIRAAHSDIRERIKWNAPSYYTRVDIVTFNLRKFDKVHLVWHHPNIESIDSFLLEGTMKGRRMSYFTATISEEERREIQRILSELISAHKITLPHTS